MNERDESAQEPGDNGNETHGAAPDGDQAAAGSSANPPSETDRLREELEQVRNKHRETEARLRTVSKAYTDLEAEMDSFRRRMTQQADQRVERKAAELVEQFFEPVQNLKRSIAAGKSDPDALVAGLEMIAGQFAEVLHKLGLQEIAGIGAVFDPTVHEALAVAPVTDKGQDGKVIMVHATGYRIGSKVLQPAQVVIGKYGEAAEA